MLSQIWLFTNSFYSNAWITLFFIPTFDEDNNELRKVRENSTLYTIVF